MALPRIGLPTEALPVTTTPAPRLKAIVLPCPAAGPPIVLVDAPESISTPDPLPRAAVPAAFVPMKLPAMTFPVAGVPLTSIPKLRLPEIRLAAPGADPPIVLPTAAEDGAV